MASSVFPLDVVLSSFFFFVWHMSENMSDHQLQAIMTMPYFRCLDAKMFSTDPVLYHFKLSLCCHFLQHFRSDHAFDLCDCWQLVDVWLSLSFCDMHLSLVVPAQVTEIPAPAGIMHIPTCVQTNYPLPPLGEGFPLHEADLPATLQT